MTHVVTARCVDCRYTDCCSVCPVDCFWEIEEPAMLMIDPDTCIDCGLCIEECPVAAIYTEEDCPDPYQEWIAKNADLYSGGTNITDTEEALPGALTLPQIQEREKSQGLEISEP